MQRITPVGAEDLRPGISTVMRTSPRIFGK